MGKQQETELERQAWNIKMFGHIRRLSSIKPPLIDDVEGVKKVCEEYFNLCEEDAVKPSIAGLAKVLGVNRTILRKWLSGEIKIQTADIILEYYSIIEIFDETAVKENKTNAVAGLFNMKNNYGYKDEVEVKHVDERKPTMKELEERYHKRVSITDIDLTKKEETPLIETSDDNAD